MDMTQKTCCFTGHRSFTKAELQRIDLRLGREIDRLIAKGVTHFISGGAVGFDQMAAMMVLSRKENGQDIRLHLALPCREQERYWADAGKRKYRFLLEHADSVCYVSDGYQKDCMKERNRVLVEQSGYCICAYTKTYSGTGQTVRMAKKKGLTVINIAKPCK